MPQNLSGLWCLLALIGLALLLHLLGPILMPFALSAVMAYMGDPIADRLEEKGLGRSAAVVVVFFAFSLVGAILLLITLPLLIEQCQLLVQRIYDGVAWLQQTALPVARKYLDLPAQSKPLDSAKDAISKHWDAAGGVLLYLWQKVSGSSMALVTWAANITLVPVVTFYLLRDWDVMIAKMRDLLPRKIEARTVQIAGECDEILGAFARGQLLVMASLGVVYAVGLWMIGLDLALVLGLGAGLASIVPYLGFIVGIASAGLAAFFQFDGWLPLVGVGAVFAFGQALESFFLTPTLVGEKIGLHPVFVIFAILAGGQLFGFLGVLLALPVAAVIKVMVLHLLEHYRQSGLYGQTEVQDGDD